MCGFEVLNHLSSYPVSPTLHTAWTGIGIWVKYRGSPTDHVENCFLKVYQCIYACYILCHAWPCFLTCVKSGTHSELINILLAFCLQMGETKKLSRPEGSKRRAKKAAVRSMNVVHRMDYGKRAPASAPAPAPVPAPNAPAALVPAPTAGAVSAPAAEGKDRVLIQICDDTSV